MLLGSYWGFQWGPYQDTAEYELYVYSGIEAILQFSNTSGSRSKAAGRPLCGEPGGRHGPPEKGLSLTRRHSTP